MDQSGIGQLAIAALVLAAISGLIAAHVSARRLWLIGGLWLFAPAILMALALGLGSLFSPGQGSTASNAVFGIMLIGIFVVVPWIVVCGIGFVIGLLLRRKRAPDAAPEPEASQRPATVVAAPTPRAAQTSQSSPDGSIRIDIEPVEWASSQWVHTPRVVEVATGRLLLDLLGSDWQADVAFPRDRYVWLGLRRFSAPGFLFAEFDLAADRYRIALRSLDAPDEEGPLGDISARLEHWWPRAASLAAARIAHDGPPPPQPRRQAFAAWRSALVILVCMIIAIAGLSWWSVKEDFQPPRVPFVVFTPR